MRFYKNISKQKKKIFLWKNNLKLPYKILIFFSVLVFQKKKTNAK